LKDSLQFYPRITGPFVVLLESVLSVIAFSGVLWGISKPRIFLVLYALIGNSVTTLVFKPLVWLNLNNSKEADFRLVWCGFAKTQKRSPYREERSRNCQTSGFGGIR